MTTENASAAGTEAKRPALTLVTSLNHFASPVDIFTVPDHAELNAGLLAAIAAWRDTDPGEKTSNRRGWHSSRTLFDRTEPPFRALQSYITNAATFVIRRYWAEFDPPRHKASVFGWANVNGQGAFNVPHAHGSNHISGCYYVSVPESPDECSGDIEFLNPAGALVAIGPFGERMAKHKFRVRPRAGQLLLFPAYLNHWVYPNMEDEERVSIAFNVLVHEPKKN